MQSAVLLVERVMFWGQDFSVDDGLDVVVLVVVVDVAVDVLRNLVVDGAVYAGFAYRCGGK
jgi:hypothetical protein